MVADIVGAPTWHTGWANGAGAADAKALGGATVAYSLVGGYRKCGLAGNCAQTGGDAETLSATVETLSVAE